MKHFKVYYGDGTTFTGLPEDAPVRNVQCIAFDDPDESFGQRGRIVMEAWDFYIYTDAVNGWVGTNKYADLLDHMEDGLGKGGVRAVLRGRWIDRDLFMAIRKRAFEDPEFLERRVAYDAIEDGIE